MRLAELINGIKAQPVNFQDVEVKAMEFDSRKVKPGTLFIALTGIHADGHDFVANAKASGACAVLTQRRVDIDLPQVIVEDSRAAMGGLAKKYFRTDERVNYIGITGTNGKTTTAFLVHSVLAACGRPAGLIGTIFYMGKTAVKAGRTTPESLDIFRLVDQFYREGSRDIVMEVSSHALSLQRVDQVVFDLALFTNLSQDHLDYHRTMDNYKQAKLRLFQLLGPDGYAVYNADDAVSADIAQLGVPRSLTFGMEHGADMKGELVGHSIEGVDVKVTDREKDHLIHSPLIGVYNCYNIIAAYAAGCAMGLPGDSIVRGLGSLQSIRGRMEKAAENVFVDFAHTPKALENVLRTLRPYTRGRLIAVFGCGGDRDKGKRPQMGKIAGQYADHSIITSDNPRSEDPRAIMSDIEQGMKKGSYQAVADRREAIALALNQQKPGDVVVIAGKGHEEYQTLKDTTIDFDDVKVVKEILAGTSRMDSSRGRQGKDACTG
ncbi:MAG TPA: UDP-N-acetylmuramoyl-L-alanyl-D-glutamate--2,6-diaminopimelate ligase [bacterium]